MYGVSAIHEREALEVAKVTVYVTDEQMARLKTLRGGMGGLSKAFQAFLDSTLAGTGAPQGRYDYARSLMPTFSAIERHRNRLARQVAAGGPPADGGPIQAALDVLLYRALVDRDPGAADRLAKELGRFGLDELVAAETEGIDLTTEPEPDEAEIDEEDDRLLGPLSVLGIDLGDEIRDVLREARLMRSDRGRGRHRSRDRRVDVRVSDRDDPREVLTAADLDRFRSRHPDWEPGERLTPSQMETLGDLLRSKAERRWRDPADDARPADDGDDAPEPDDAPPPSAADGSESTGGPDT
ncbi:MAG TPA: hypothetical protein VHN98_01735 [Acidimicrobiales bacterium]|nr:hypothetical protein [Acidimicrobiales bacterium]